MVQENVQLTPFPGGISTAFRLPPLSRLLLECTARSALHVKTASTGSIEFLGFELPSNAEIILVDPDSTSAPTCGDHKFRIQLWTFTGTTVEVSGAISDSWLGPSRSIGILYNAHAILRNKRIQCLRFLQSSDTIAKLRSLWVKCSSIEHNLSSHQALTQEEAESFLANAEVFTVVMDFCSDWLFPVPEVANIARRNCLNQLVPPFVLVFGPVHESVGLSHQLCGWARKDGDNPLFIELDPSATSSCNAGHSCDDRSSQSGNSASGSSQSKSKPWINSIAALQFPPGTIGAVEVTDLITFGFKLERASGVPVQREAPFVTSSLIPSLLADGGHVGALPRHPSLSKLCILCPSSSEMLSSTETLRTAILLSVAADILSLACLAKFDFASFQPTVLELPTPLVRLASGFIAHYTARSGSPQMDLIARMIGANIAFAAASVDEEASPEVMNPLFVDLAAPPLASVTRQTTQHRIDAIMLPPLMNQASVNREPEQNEIASETNITPCAKRLQSYWLEYFFGHCNATMRAKAAAEQIPMEISAPGRSLECPLISIAWSIFHIGLCGKSPTVDQISKASVENRVFAIVGECRSIVHGFAMVLRVRQKTTTAILDMFIPSVWKHDKNSASLGAVAEQVITSAIRRHALFFVFMAET